MYKIYALFLIFFTMFPLGAYAEEPVGKVVSIEGRADITRPGASAVPAAPEEMLYVGDVIRTKSRSKAAVSFTDGSVLRLGASSRVEITEYLFEEDRTQASLKLFRGKIQSIVNKARGLFGMSAPNRFEVNTPTATIGVRGTNFFTYYQDGISGSIFVEGRGYCYSMNQPDRVREIYAGQAMTVINPYTPPVLRSVTNLEIQKNLKDTTPAPQIEKDDNAPHSDESAGMLTYAPKAKQDKKEQPQTAVANKKPAMPDEIEMTDGSWRQEKAPEDAVSGKKSDYPVSYEMEPSSQGKDNIPHGDMTEGADMMPHDGPQPEGMTEGSEMIPHDAPPQPEIDNIAGMKEGPEMMAYDAPQSEGMKEGPEMMAYDVPRPEIDNIADMKEGPEMMAYDAPQSEGMKEGLEMMTYDAPRPEMMPYDAPQPEMDNVMGGMKDGPEMTSYDAPPQAEMDNIIAGMTEGPEIMPYDASQTEINDILKEVPDTTYYDGPDVEIKDTAYDSGNDLISGPKVEVPYDEDRIGDPPPPDGTQAPLPPDGTDDGAQEPPPPEGNGDEGDNNGSEDEEEEDPPPPDGSEEPPLPDETEEPPLPDGTNNLRSSLKSEMKSDIHIEVFQGGSLEKVEDNNMAQSLSLKDSADIESALNQLQITLEDPKSSKKWIRELAVDSGDNGSVGGTGHMAWVDIDQALTGIGGGKFSGTFDPNEHTWQIAEKWAALDTRTFLKLSETRAGREKLMGLNIPAIEIGRASLSGSSDKLNVQMNDVTFFSYRTGGDPRVWATNDVAGTYKAPPDIGHTVNLTGGGLKADFQVSDWNNRTWGATINGSGTLQRTDVNKVTNTQFSGYGVGVHTGGQSGGFSGTAAGLAGP